MKSIYEYVNCVAGRTLCADDGREPSRAVQNRTANEERKKKEDGVLRRPHNIFPVMDGAICKIFPLETLTFSFRFYTS